MGHEPEKDLDYGAVEAVNVLVKAFYEDLVNDLQLVHEFSSSINELNSEVEEHQLDALDLRQVYLAEDRQSNLICVMEVSMQDFTKDD